MKLNQQKGDVKSITLTYDQLEVLRGSLSEVSPLATVTGYSGRAGYGLPCLAIETEYPEQTLLGLVYDLMADATEGTAELARLLAVRHDVQSVRIGWRTVIYWPTIALPGDAR